MKKKFDIRSTIGIPNRQLTPEQIDLATQKIHAKPEAAPKSAGHAEPGTAKKTATKNQKPVAAKPKKAPKLVAEPPVSVVEEPAAVYRTANQPQHRAEPGKKIRLSVDVLPSVHKQLKLRAIQNDTDIMHYVEMLIERDLAKP